MNNQNASHRFRPALLGVAALLGATVTGSAFAGAHKDDSRTCARFGAPHGSREYARCMLTQQRRRDDAPLRAAEQQRLSAEAARNNLETVRRMRCERAAKQERRRGERPRHCW